MKNFKNCQICLQLCLRISQVKHKLANSEAFYKSALISSDLLVGTDGGWIDAWPAACHQRFSDGLILCVLCCLLHRCAVHFSGVSWANCVHKIRRKCVYHVDLMSHYGEHFASEIETRYHFLLLPYSMGMPDDRWLTAAETVLTVKLCFLNGRIGRCS